MNPHDLEAECIYGAQNAYFAQSNVQKFYRGWLENAAHEVEDVPA